MKKWLQVEIKLEFEWIKTSRKILEYYKESPEI